MAAATRRCPEKGKPVERQGRKVTGLKGLGPHDSGTARMHPSRLPFRCVAARLRIAFPASRRVSTFTGVRKEMEREQATKFIHDLLRADGRAQRLRPVHHRRLPAGDQGRRQDHAGVAAAADRRSTRSTLARSIMNDKQAAEFEAHQGVQLRDRAAGHRPLPRQRLRAAGPRRHGAAHDHHRRSRRSRS